jgi:hypothetical protein
MNLTPGGSISNSKKSTCGGCRAEVLLGQIRDDTSTIRWHNFDLPAVEKDGLRYYRRHFCARKSLHRAHKYDGRLVGAR